MVGGRPIEDLAGTVLDALYPFPPLNLFAVFGLPTSWAPWRRFSEFGIANLLRPTRTATYLADVLVPSVPLTAPSWLPPQLSWLTWHPTLLSQRPDHADNPTTFPQETWLFVNGIMTDNLMAQLNAAYLAYLFHRPVVVAQNSTGGLAEDLLECALDKAALRTGEAATKVFPAIYDAIRDPNKTRVVVIAHSQGTIIAGVVLRFLRLVRESAAGARLAPAAEAAMEPEYLDDMPLNPADFEPPTDAEIGKLELYCLANCASQMRYLDAALRRPWIESFGNEYDLVARLGVLAPNPAERHIHIDGPRYVHPGAFGHFLNAHYLHDIDRVQKRGRRPGPRQQNAAPFTLVDPPAETLPEAQVPRLYRYLNGGAPAEPPWVQAPTPPRPRDGKAPVTASTRTPDRPVPAD